MEEVKIVVVGAGPAGIATAVEAKRVNIQPVVVLEKAKHVCDTIVTLYHEGKRVDPVFRKVKVEPIGALSFDTESREEFLKRMEHVIQQEGLVIHTGQEVNKITRQGDSFLVSTSRGMQFQAGVVVVAIGVFGKPVKPAYPIPAALKDRVFFSLPKTPITGEKVLVVGGGDTAAETACFLAEHNKVCLSYRRPEFFRLNEINACNIKGCSAKGVVELMMATDIEGLEPAENGVLVKFKDGRNMEFDRVFYCLGGSTPQAFLEGCGVEFQDNRPVIGPDGETNVKGLFLVGDLVAKTGTIMAAFNSAKTAMDGIRAKYGARLY
jgi:thioredoxin reductase (NADPH)